MKTVFAMILMMALYDAQALEIRVKSMKKSAGFDRKYDLKTSIDEKVTLDCQSFVQGLFFGQVGESVIMLQEWECADLVSDMKRSHLHLKKHCLNVDPEQSVLESQATCQ